MHYTKRRFLDIDNHYYTWSRRERYISSESMTIEYFIEKNSELWAWFEQIKQYKKDFPLRVSCYFMMKYSFELISSDVNKSFNDRRHDGGLEALASDLAKLGWVVTVLLVVVVVDVVVPVVDVVDIVDAVGIVRLT